MEELRVVDWGGHQGGREAGRSWGTGAVSRSQRHREELRPFPAGSEELTGFKQEIRFVTYIFIFYRDHPGGTLKSGWEARRPERKLLE